MFLVRLKRLWINVKTVESEHPSPGGYQPVKSYDFFWINLLVPDGGRCSQPMERRKEQEREGKHSV